MPIKKKKEGSKPVPLAKLPEAERLPMGFENPPQIESQFYSLKDHCFNCDEEFYLQIPKGTPKPKDAVCPFCLCADGK